MSTLTATAATEVAEHGTSARFTAADGYEYTVVVTPAGTPSRVASWGPDDHATVRFYDLTSGRSIADRKPDGWTDDTDREFFRTVGQDTGASYYAETLLASSSGLHLSYGSPFWQIDAETMEGVRAFIRANV